MLNKHGEGILYFGVKNNGDVIGQKDITDSTVRDVSRKISEGIKPQVIPTISVEYYENLKVIKVVTKGKNAPYSTFEKYYIRSYDEDKKVTPKLLAEMINKTGEPDLIIEEEASNPKLSFKILKNLFAINGLTVNEKTFEANN
ncbi:MAG: ATP-binding protein [Clostridia bacterium]|nr:ATP-binding protein [Clostridia bacterium]